MRPEELTCERLERLVKLAAAGLSVNIDTLEAGETIATKRWNSCLSFYITKYQVIHSVAVFFRNEKDAATAQAILEEKGLDEMLFWCWSEYPALPQRKFELGYRGMTEERWDDLFYFMVNEMVYFVWRGKTKESIEWEPILICNDLWMLACSDFAYLPIEQFSRLRQVHELYNWYGQAAWACHAEGNEPHPRTASTDQYKAAREWCQTN